jgi:putative selenate reductase
VHEPEIPLQARRGFDEVLGPLPTDQAMIEADRCLVCHTMCSLCVTVCPNRANQMYVVKPFKADLPILSVQGGELIVDGTQSFAIDQTYQIVNLADFCNECGNCTTFCPTAGAPFRDKPRLHLSQESYEKAWYDAYRVVPEGEGVMVMARLGGREHRLMCSKDGIRYEGQGVTVQFDGATFGMIEAEAAQELPEGLRIDLSIAARMMIVSNARSVLVE